MFIYQNQYRGWGDGSLGKYLLFKYDGLSLIPRIHITKERKEKKKGEAAATWRQGSKFVNPVLGRQSKEIPEACQSTLLQVKE